jgi:hypothetical protein
MGPTRRMWDLPQEGRSELATLDTPRLNLLRPHVVYEIRALESRLCEISHNYALDTA